MMRFVPSVGLRALSAPIRTASIMRCAMSSRDINDGMQIWYRIGCNLNDITACEKFYSKFVEIVGPSDALLARDVEVNTSFHIYTTSQAKVDEIMQILGRDQHKCKVHEYFELYPNLSEAMREKSTRILGNLPLPSDHVQKFPWSAEPLEAKGGRFGGLLCYEDELSNDSTQATRELCRHSMGESFVHTVRHLQSREDETRSLLLTVYNAVEGRKQHLARPYYDAWQKETRRAGTEGKFATLFPSPLLLHKSPAIIYPDIAEPGPRSTVAGTVVEGEKGLKSAYLSNFAFQGPRIVMGRGVAPTAIQSALKSVKAAKPLLIVGRGGLVRLRGMLEEALGSSFDFSSLVVNAQGEPLVEEAVAAAQKARDMGCDCVLSVGGGSALDMGKAVSALARNSHRDVFDFLEVIGKGLPLDHDPLPFIAVPTTSGTGSEATKNAVLKCNVHKRKVSIRHDKMFPVAAILDPLLTLSCPPSVTAHVGMDTLCQVLEPFVCNSPNPFVDALSREGIIRASRALRTAVANGQDLEAREDMAIASVFGGLSLANAKLGAVHGFAAVLGGMYEDAPHGAICASLLPYVFEANVKALQKMMDEASTSDLRNEIFINLHRFVEASRLMTNNAAAGAEDGILWLHALLRDIEIPPLAQLCKGMAQTDFDEIASATLVASSTKGNPVKLSAEDLKDILMKAF